MYTLVYDYDGTFKNPNGLSKEAIEKLKTFLKNPNNRILIISEAPIEEIMSYTSKLDLRIDIFSMGSLSFLYDNKLRHNLLDKDLIKDINDKFKDDIYTAYGEGIDINYIYSYQERLKMIYPKNYSTKYVDLSYYIIAIKTEFKDKLIDYITSNNIAYDMLGTDPNRTLIRLKKYQYNKKDAVLEYKKESPNNILIGFSDSSYDLPFLSECNVIVAMKTADWHLKSKADYITEYDCNNDGAILILDDICKM